MCRNSSTFPKDSKRTSQEWSDRTVCHIVSCQPEKKNPEPSAEKRTLDVFSWCPRELSSVHFYMFFWVVDRIFIMFNPTRGNDPIWRAYFSIGLQTPIVLLCITKFWVRLWISLSSPNIPQLFEGIKQKKFRKDHLTRPSPIKFHALYIYLYIYHQNQRSLFLFQTNITDPEV